jgi:hypothetical protein
VATIPRGASSASRAPGFVYLEPFIRAAKALFSERDLQHIEQTLIADPETGQVIAGTGGLRKMRVALPGAGKRGGARLIYYYRGPIGRIYLVTTYPKREKDNLTNAERNAFKRMTARLDLET